MSENKKKRSGLFGRPQQSAGQPKADVSEQAGVFRKKGRVGRTIGTILLVMVLTIAIFTGIFMTWINTSLKGHVEVYIDELETKVSTELYYLDAKTDEWVMYQTLYSDGQNRIWSSLDTIPKYLQDAAVAIEDKRFEKHHGVDLRGTVRAILSTLTGRGVQGGSTITQQLIKNVTGDNQNTVKRKVTEIYRALELEKRYTKDQILEAYLNRIYMGQSCYGVEAASRTYFGKSVSELTLAQCASLIAITNNPSQFGPFEGEWSREQNRSRQLLVLDAMLDQEKISQQEYDAAKAEEVIFTNGYSNTGNYYGDVVAAQTTQDEPDAVETVTTYKARNSYFTDALIEDVIEALMEEYGLTQDEAAQRVGKSRPAVANAMRLLSLPDELLALVEEGKLTAGHARAILSLKEKPQQLAVAQKVINLQLSVRQTEAMCKKLSKAVKTPEPKPVEVDYLAECEKSLSRRLGRGVKIVSGKRKGKIELEYYGQEDLQRLYEALTKTLGKEQP